MTCFLIYPDRFDYSNPAPTRPLKFTLTLPPKLSGKPGHLQTLGFPVTQGSSVFTMISTSLPYKKLWIGFMTHLDIWLETFSNFGFCDKDSILPLTPSVPL